MLSRKIAFACWIAKQKSKSLTEHPESNSSLKSSGHAIDDRTRSLQCYELNIDQLLTAFPLFILYTNVGFRLLSC